MKKLNVLYIATDPFMGGSTASLLNLLDEIKDQINPIVLYRKESVGYDTFVKHGIECYAFPYIMLPDFKANRFADVWSHPWRWHPIYKYWNNYSCYQYVKQILNGRSIDVVHSNTSLSDVGVSLSKRLNAKHVWHVREFWGLHFHFDMYLPQVKLRQLINQADGRIAISSAIKEHWQMQKQNTWVVNDAIRSEKDACYIKEKEKYFLFSSYNLTEEKGSRKAIEAFAQSEMFKNGYKLKMMGNCSDEYHESLLCTAHELNVADAIEFVPCQVDVKSVVVRATAYLMMSVYEGLGRVTGEAMFYGCPVIAHASGGTLDLIKHGETGYLFSSINECAELIKYVCSEPQEKLIQQAQLFAVDNLSQEVYAPRIIDVYNSIIAK